MSTQKSARDLQVGESITDPSVASCWPDGNYVTKVDTTTNPGTVYVWLDSERHLDGPADVILSHGEPVKVARDLGPYDCQSEFGPHEHDDENTAERCQHTIYNMNYAADDAYEAEMFVPEQREDLLNW